MTDQSDTGTGHSTGGRDQKCWACDRALGHTLDLTNDEIDALYEHLMETEQDADPFLARHMSSILDKLPESETLTRDPPAELRAELSLKCSVEPDSDHNE